MLTQPHRSRLFFLLVLTCLQVCFCQVNNVVNPLRIFYLNYQYISPEPRIIRYSTTTETSCVAKNQIKHCKVAVNKQPRLTSTTSKTTDKLNLPT